MADENISFKVVETLRGKGIDVISAKEISNGLSDRAILNAANKQKRVLITFDGDFGELVFRQKLGAQGVVFLKFAPKSSNHIVGSIENLVRSQIKIEGHFLVDEKSIHVRRLKTSK